MNIQRPVSKSVPVAFRFASGDAEEPSQVAPEPAPKADGTPRRRWAARPRKSPAPDLSPRAVAVLTRRSWSNRRPACRHPTGAARKVVLSPRSLIRAAERATREELLALRGVGPIIVDEIETWLGTLGKQFRSDPVPVKTALAQALAHIEAMLDRTEEDAFLAAFLALPELRRSLSA